MSLGVGMWMATWVVMCVVMTTPISVAAPAAKTSPLQLSAQETQTVAQAACDSKGAVKLSKVDAWTEASGESTAVNTAVNTQVSARVECGVHQRTADYSVQKVATCIRTTSWRCDKGGLAIKAKLGKHTVSIYSASHDAETAYTLVKKLEAYRALNGGRVMRADIKRCEVAPGPFQELVDVTCDDKLFRISYFCPQSSCPRIYAVGAFYMPPTEGGL